MLLRGWKEIAQHLRCGVRTAQRYATHGLPVKRLGRSRKASVMAESGDLDNWVRRGGLIPKGNGQASPLVGRSQELVAEIQENRAALRRNVSSLRASFGTLFSIATKQADFRNTPAKGRR